MKKTGLVILAAVLVLGAVALAGCSSEGTSLGNGNIGVSLNSQQTGIWVSGEGEVYAVPDIAVLDVGVESQEASVAEAQANAADAMDKIIAALKDAGVADEDIQTQDYSIRDITTWDDEKNEQIVVGYRVTNSVIAKIRQVDAAGEIIDAAVAAGGDLVRVDGIQFTVEDPASYYEDARALAVADAKAKAEQMAELTGVVLGKVTYLSESTYMPTTYRYLDTMAEMAIPAVTVAAEGTSVSPGQLTVTATVQIAYAID